MKKRPSAPLLISILVHLVVAIVLIEAVSFRYSLAGLFGSHEQRTAEQLRYVQLHPRESAAPSAGPRNAPISTRPMALPPLHAPTSIPAGIPPVPSGAATADTGARGIPGPLGGNPGPARGASPAYTDGRVWVGPAPAESPPLTSAQRLDSALKSRIAVHNDSMAAIAELQSHQRKPGDWTIKKGGETYGIDQQYIHLGKFSIPTAVLALLPLNVQGNPSAMENEHRLNMMHGEIMEQAQRAMNDAEFREAVKRIRERKERERIEEQKAEEAAGRQAAPSSGVGRDTTSH